MTKTYAIRLKLVGEIVLLNGDDDGGNLDVASIRKDFGKLAEAVCDSSELRAKAPCNSTAIANSGEVLHHSMIDMLHVARDMEMGKFRGKAFADAVKNGVLSGGSLRGDVGPELVQKLSKMGLTANSPLVDLSKVN
jgi:hypothetical protein